MQSVLDVLTTSIPTVSQADAQRTACDYAATHIDPSFEVVRGTRYYHKPLGREIWQFIVRCAAGPLDAIAVDVQTGAIIPLAEDKIRVIREKAAVYTARKQGVLPIDAQGYVLGEYARRRAERHLGEQIGMFFNAADPVFVPGDAPRWQVTIVFKRYHLGPFTLGIMDVDATTGEPIPLSKRQLKRIRERAHALVEFHAQTAAA